MQAKPIALALRSNPSRYGHAGVARLVNMYSEETGTDSKAAWNIHAVDGLKTFATLPLGPIRAMLALTDNDLYVVSGRGLYRVDATGAATFVGGIATDGPVTMARNRASPPNIAIVSDGIAYHCTANVLTQNLDPDLPPPVSVTALDGYFDYLTLDGRHFASDLDAPDVTAISYASAESNPDGGVRNWSRGRDLCIGGTRSLEFWQNVGGDPYPFQRTTAIDVGVLAADSVATVDQTSAFVAHDNTVRMLQGYQAQEISTHAVTRFIEGEDPAKLRGCSWQRSGHTFYGLRGETSTWVYDLKTGNWHNRASHRSPTWRCGKTVQFGRRIIAGDMTTGKLYELDPETYDEVGDELVCEVVNPPTHGFPYRIRYNQLFVDVVPGVGRVGQPDHIENPAMLIDYSDDGGATFGGERSVVIGREGDRLRRVTESRWGVSRSRSWRFRVSAAVARSFVSCSMTTDTLDA